MSGYTFRKNRVRSSLLLCRIQYHIRFCGRFDPGGGNIALALALKQFITQQEEYRRLQHDIQA
jgi:hypothetical protein